MTEVRKALISVSDKTGVIEFAKELRSLNIEIISTGGTAKLLRENNVACNPISEITGFPEMLDGRVKTLHPKILGGILARRENDAHLNQLKENNIGLIDLIVVNLYPFEETISKSNVSVENAIENIDIGGPTMIRSAAKNYKDVAVVVSPNQYNNVIDELKGNNSGLSEDTLFKLAVEAFHVTNKYDGKISEYLSNVKANTTFPERYNLSLKKSQELRYGENPHQKAAFYSPFDETSKGFANIEQLNGKELSYNNIMDLDSVVKIVHTFKEPCSVIVKHSNPCGVAIGKDSHDAFKKAFATDSLSAFGGIYGFNRVVDLPLVEELAKIFIEVIIAPKYTPDALKRLQRKKNLRVLKLPTDANSRFMIKDVLGGILIQEQDIYEISDIDFKIVSKRQPTESEMKTLKFGWQVVKWIKSNAIVFVASDRTIGVGAGQMSRVDSVNLAIEKAQRAGLSLKNTMVASDAFFPFRDGVDKAAEAGATAIIQPGGSVRDEEVINAVNEHNMIMIFTGVRHFRH